MSYTISRSKRAAQASESEIKVYADFLISSGRNGDVRLRLVSWRGGTKEDAIWDLRRWYRDDEGEEKPGKGISLSEGAFATLVETIQREFSVEDEEPAPAPKGTAKRKSAPAKEKQTASA